MTTQLRSAMLAAGAVVLGLAGASALARSPDAQAVYESERAACMQGRSNQDRATCLKEARAALQEARRGRLATPGESDLERNRLARCGAQKGVDRDDCIMRMQGGGTTTGSARAGGILRESERLETTR